MARKTKRTRRKCLGARCSSGDRRALGKLNWKGATKRARIIVGAKPGKEACWKRGPHRKRCERLGKRGPPVDVFDDYVLKTRNRQIGRSKVGLTRYSTRGYYQGKGERSYVFDIIDDGSDGSAERFRKHMQRIAEGLSRRFCQDEVLVEFVSSTGRTTTRSYLTDSCRIR